MFQLNSILKNALEQFQFISRQDWEAKPNPKKWSKKEILGHLIDSAHNNLQRFTEIQQDKKPYAMRGYRQDDLVLANAYQSRDHKKIIALWVALNEQISYVMDQQTDKTLAYEVQLPDGNISDLRFLMEDYVVHLKHHLNQIL